MKDNAYERIMDSKAGKILAGSLVYGIMFEILLYRNMNGIGIPVLMLTTCLFLIGFLGYLRCGSNRRRCFIWRPWYYSEYLPY